MAVLSLHAVAVAVLGQRTPRRSRLIMSFILRDPDPKLWAKFKTRAASEGRTLRWVILELIRRYVEKGLD
jgi:hypothetical protein